MMESPKERKFRERVAVREREREGVIDNPGERESERSNGLV